MADVIIINVEIAKKRVPDNDSIGSFCVSSIKMNKETSS